MLNLLPKSIIINNILETLRKDPEYGVVKLLEKIKVKTPEDQALMNQVLNYYTSSPTAKMQIKNLVYNTDKKILYAFAEKIYDTFNKQPLMIDFLRLVSVEEVMHPGTYDIIFPIIELKSLNESVKNMMMNMKNNGNIFFTSLVVTPENFKTVTSDEVVYTLIKNGVRGIFYRLKSDSPQLESAIIQKIHEIRTTKPILAFYMKPIILPYEGTYYQITEIVNGTPYSIDLRVR